jgi:hypothetical protein
MQGPSVPGNLEEAGREALSRCPGMSGAAVSAIGMGQLRVPPGASQ